MSQGKSAYRRAINELGRDGYTVTTTGGSHLKITHPLMAGFVICSFSPRCPSNSLTKVRANLRRAHRAYEAAHKEIA